MNKPSVAPPQKPPAPPLVKLAWGKGPPPSASTASPNAAPSRGRDPGDSSSSATTPSYSRKFSALAPSVAVKDGVMHHSTPSFNFGSTDVTIPLPMGVATLHLTDYSTPPVKELRMPAERFGSVGLPTASGSLLASSSASPTSTNPLSTPSNSSYVATSSTPARRRGLDVTKFFQNQLSQRSQNGFEELQEQDPVLGALMRLPRTADEWQHHMSDQHPVTPYMQSPTMPPPPGSNVLSVSFASGVTNQDVHGGTHTPSTSGRTESMALASSGARRSPPTEPLTQDVGDNIIFDAFEPFDTRGHFCDLFLGEHTTVGKVALKRLRHRGGGEGNAEIMSRHFRRESDIWMKLRHDRILPCLGVFTRERNLYLVSPYMKNGSLFDWVRSAIHVGLERLQLIHELADALVYLHSSGIVHGDVKANNVLLSDDMHVQVCDFGLTKLAESATTTTLKGAGSIRWQSPELWDNEPKSFKSDVYAFSMTIVEVLTSDVPFAAMVHDSAVMKAVLKCKRPSRLPWASPDGTSYEISWRVAERCWSEDPGQRISMQEAIEHFPLCIEKH